MNELGLNLSQVPRENLSSACLVTDLARYTRLPGEEALKYMQRIVELNGENPPGNEIITRFTKLVVTDKKIFRCVLRQLPTLRIGLEYTDLAGVFRHDPFFSLVYKNPELLNTYVRGRIKRPEARESIWTLPVGLHFQKQIAEHLHSPFLSSRLHQKLSNTLAILDSQSMAWTIDTVSSEKQS